MIPRDEAGRLLEEQHAEVAALFAELDEDAFTVRGTMGGGEAKIESGVGIPVADLTALPQNTLLTRKVNDVAVVVYRDGDDITVMLERCAHQGGPLGAGSVTRVDGHVCVVCPWHGSTFQLDDGEVVHGPAGTDQQILPTRVLGGVVQTRLP